MPDTQLPPPPREVGQFYTGLLIKSGHYRLTFLLDEDGWPTVSDIYTDVNDEQLLERLKQSGYKTLRIIDLVNT